MSQCKMFISWPCTGKLIYTAHFAIVYTPVSVHVHVCGVCVCVTLCSVCAYHMIAHLYSIYANCTGIAIGEQLHT